MRYGVDCIRAVRAPSPMIPCGFSSFLVYISVLYPHHRLERSSLHPVDDSVR